MRSADPATPAGDGCGDVRPAHPAPRCRAAARRIRAGDRGRASLRATDSRARKRCRASSGRPARRVRNDANARAGRQGRRRRRAQKNAEAVRALQQDADASSEDEGRPDVLLVQARRQATLAPCGPCLRRRGVSVLYCSRKCQREAWQTHKPICAATPWSLAQHRFHGKGQREYVQRLVQDHLIHTLAWRREPSHASSLLTGRILPYLLSYSPPPPGWSRHWSPPVKRYALSLTLIWARTLAYERESANARGVWRDHVLPFLLDASTAVPAGW